MKPNLRLLDDDLTGQIIDEAKNILGTIGVDVQGSALRRRLLDGGLKFDREGKRILFPPEAVEEAIRTIPTSFSLYNRDGEPHAEIGGENVHFTPGSSGLSVLDHRSGETRPATTADFVEYVRLADGLPNITYLATAFSTNDIDPIISDAWRLYLCLVGSRKPVVSGAFSEHGVPRMVEMMQLFRRDRSDLIERPLSIFTITPTGMFRYSEDSCQNLLDCVEAGIPVEIVPVTLMGLIAPVALVGAAVFHTADVLAGLTMAQIIKPGAPVLFGGAPAAFHMQTTAAPMSAVEALRLDAAYAAVAKSLGVPAQAYMALSDSKFLDAQAGAETFGGALLAALSGVNSVSGPGMLDYVLTFSLAKLVFDDELCGQALAYVREVKTLADVPALELARDLLAKQHLLTAEHTLDHWKQELYMPGSVIDRDNRDNWKKAGSPTLEKRVYDEVERRLAAYAPPETDARIEAEMRRIIQSGMVEKRPLPAIPPLPDKLDGSAARSDRARSRRPRPTGRTPGDI
jgi:trimethylamine--corrinoid protein Co-methyltransferase